MDESFTVKNLLRWLTQAQSHKPRKRLPPPTPISDHRAAQLVIERDFSNSHDSQLIGLFKKAAAGKLSASELLNQLEEKTRSGKHPEHIALISAFQLRRRQAAKELAIKTKSREIEPQKSEFDRFKKDARRIALKSRRYGAEALHDSPLDFAREWVSRETGITTDQLDHLMRAWRHGSVKHKSTAKISQKISFPANILLKDMAPHWPTEVKKFISQYGQPTNLVDQQTTTQTRLTKLATKNLERKRGRKPLPADEITRRDEIIDQWLDAKSGGVSRKVFCEDKEIPLKQLERVLAWHSTRRHRDDTI